MSIKAVVKPVEGDGRARVDVEFTAGGRKFVVHKLGKHQARVMGERIAALDSADRHLCERAWVLSRVGASEFALAYEGARTYPVGTLHRFNCGLLLFKARAAHPGDIYPITVEHFTEGAHDQRSGNGYKVCQLCCSDLDESKIVAPSKLARRK